MTIFCLKVINPNFLIPPKVVKMISVPKLFVPESLWITCRCGMFYLIVAERPQKFICGSQIQKIYS